MFLTKTDKKVEVFFGVKEGEARITITSEDQKHLTGAKASVDDMRRFLKKALEMLE